MAQLVHHHRVVQRHPHVIGSCSYDFTVRTWDFTRPPGNQTLQVFDDHTEFVIGLDFNTHKPGQVADCAWDDSVVLRTVMPPSQ